MIGLSPLRGRHDNRHPKCVTVGMAKINDSGLVAQDVEDYNEFERFLRLIASTCFPLEISGHTMRRLNLNIVESVTTWGVNIFNFNVDT